MDRDAAWCNNKGAIGADFRPVSDAERSDRVESERFLQGLQLRTQIVAWNHRDAMACEHR